MKKVLLFSVLVITFFSCSTDNSNETKKYITDNNFEIQVVKWESWGDITNDGITQNVLIESGSGEIVNFIKSTGELGDLNANVNDKEFASSSLNGLLIFNNYWDSTPKIINFTMDNQFTLEYDSRKDSQSGSYEVSKTIGYFKKI